METGITVAVIVVAIAFGVLLIHRLNAQQEDRMAVRHYARRLSAPGRGQGRGRDRDRGQIRQRARQRHDHGPWTTEPQTHEQPHPTPRPQPGAFERGPSAEDPEYADGGERRGMRPEGRGRFRHRRGNAAVGNAGDHEPT